MFQEAMASKHSPKKTAMRTRKASKKSKGNGSVISLTERKKLKREILQQFALNPVPLEVTIKPDPTAIAVITATLSGGSGADPDAKCIENAIDLWNRCAFAMAVREREKCRRDAIRKLLFRDGEEKVPLDEFLRRLLPNDSIEKREELFQDTMVRFPTFLKLFEHGAVGWPAKQLSDLRDYEPGPDWIGFMRSCNEEVREGVTFVQAYRIAPLVLAWRELISSPQYRGSVRQAKPKDKSDAPPTQAEGTEPEVETDSPGVDQSEQVTEGELASDAATEEAPLEDEQTPDSGNEEKT